MFNIMRRYNEHKIQHCAIILRGQNTHIQALALDFHLLTVKKKDEGKGLKGGGVGRVGMGLGMRDRSHRFLV